VSGAVTGLKGDLAGTHSNGMRVRESQKGMKDSIAIPNLDKIGPGGPPSAREAKKGLAYCDSPSGEGRAMARQSPAFLDSY